MGQKRWEVGRRARRLLAEKGSGAGRDGWLQVTEGKLRPQRSRGQIPGYKVAEVGPNLIS